MTSNEEQLAAPSEDFQYYIDQYKIKHAEGYTSFAKFSPTYLDRERIKEVCLKYNVKTLLDYGIAQGVHYTEMKLHEYWELDSYTGYDPAVERFSQKPTGKFDAVLCYDTLEHVPEGSIDYVIQDLLSFSDKLALVRVETSPAATILPNGENAHITLHTKEWWKEKFLQHRRPGQIIVFHGLEI